MDLAINRPASYGYRDVSVSDRGKKYAKIATYWWVLSTALFIMLCCLLYCPVYRAVWDGWVMNNNSLQRMYGK